MKAIVFDLDGTLLHTLGDIAAALNHALRSMGFPERSLPEVRQGVGHGLARLAEASVPPGTPPEEMGAVLERLNSHYRLHPTDLSRPYPGITPLLDRLQAGGRPLGLLSNKDDDLVSTIADHFFPGRFSPCLGLRPGHAPKPDPAVLLEIVRGWGFNADEVLYVGDSEVDVETARRAGTGFLGVGWGYRDSVHLQEAGDIIWKADEFPL